MIQTSIKERQRLKGERNNGNRLNAYQMRPQNKNEQADVIVVGRSG